MLSLDAQRTGRKTNAPAPLPNAVQRAIDLLKAGGVVAFPTDTLYGLGADFSCVEAVKRVIDIKGRPEQMGLPLLLSDEAQLAMVAMDIPEAAWLLARRFWPGALTLVVPRSPNVPDIVTGGRPTVAVRVPGHPVPRALAKGLGRPITGTSANATGQPPAVTSEEVKRSLGSAVDLVIGDSGSPRGLPSTIVDATGPVLRLVRSGAVSLTAIQKVYPEVVEVEPIRGIARPASA